MNANDPLTEAIGECQRKHRIADGDPMIAALELVRIYLQHSRKIDITKNQASSPVDEGAEQVGHGNGANAFAEPALQEERRCINAVRISNALTAEGKLSAMDVYPNDMQY